MTLNNRQIRHLRGLAHQTRPVVIVGDKGLSEAVTAEIDNALTHHEFIKVRIRADREQRQAWFGEIERTCRAECVQTVGQVACFFRRNPEKPVVTFPNQA